MSLDGLQLDADGYLDMDQFPDDGTDLAGADLEQLRDVLHADPVEEPTPEQWDAIFDEVVGAEGDAGPFALDDADADAVGPEDVDVVDTDEPVTDDDTEDDDTDDDAADPGDTDDDPAALGNAPADDLDLEDVTSDDLDVDVDGGLDLAADDTVDDAYAPEALDDGPAELAPDFEDLL